MKIRKAIPSDKKPVLNFCKTTFSWGDYISDVWDHWISEGILLVLTIDEKPVAICHSSIIGDDQVWIEGIRVKKNFRRKGLAKYIVKETEVIAKKNNCKLAKMLIETKNTNSLNLAGKLNYTKEEKWDFYSLLPKKIAISKHVKFVKNEKVIQHILQKSTSSYVRSWRWIPLSKSVISSLIKGKKILASTHKGVIYGLAILMDSDHFEKTLMITLLYEKNEGLSEIISYIQNLSFQKNSKRIQILTKLPSLPKHVDLEKRFSFFLMKKEL